MRLKTEATAKPPLTVELLADLQAGLLCDEDAVQVRKQVREDPQAQRILRALNQVRRDVAATGAVVVSDTSPDLTDRLFKLSKALRSVGSNESATAAHSVRPHTRPARVIAGIAGLCAVVAAIGLGTTTLVNVSEPTPSGPTTAGHITVSAPTTAIPLSEEQLLNLLNRTPDYGPLGDPMRRTSCLSGLGYPASTPVLGAQPIDINARTGVVLVIPGDTPDTLAVVAVAPNCNAADTGLLASTLVPRL